MVLTRKYCFKKYAPFFAVNYFAKLQTLIFTKRQQQEAVQFLPLRLFKATTITVSLTCRKILYFFNQTFHLEDDW